MKLKEFMENRKMLKEVQKEWKSARAVLRLRNLHRSASLDEYMEALLHKFEMLDLLNDNSKLLHDIELCYMTNPKVHDILKNFSPHSLTKEECSVLTDELKRLKALSKLRFEHYYIQGAEDFLAKAEVPYDALFMKLYMDSKKMKEDMED